MYLAYMCGVFKKLIACLFSFLVLSKSRLRIHCKQTLFFLPCSSQRNAPESAVQVAFFLPQLVQLLRADEGGMIQEFLFTAARRSTLFGHKLICTLRVRLSQ